VPARREHVDRKETVMSEDATSQPSEPQDTAPATGEDTAEAEKALAEAVAHATGDNDTTEPGDGDSKPEPAKPADDKLGDSGKRALVTERQARRDAEKRLRDAEAQLQQYVDRDKTDLQKAQEAAQKYQQELTATRVANARLMAAATHNLPPDAIDLLGDGTDEEIDARAKLLAEMIAAAAPAPASAEPAKQAPAPTRPVESLVPGAKPASEQPENPNAWLRRMAGRT
jgi:hypothetical protein